MTWVKGCGKARVGLHGMVNMMCSGACSASATWMCPWLGGFAITASATKGGAPGRPGSGSVHAAHVDARISAMIVALARHLLQELIEVVRDELPARHHHVLHQLPRIAREREELDAVGLDELAEHRMGCEPHAMAVARQTLRDRQERLHVAPGADDQDGDRERRNRPRLVECVLCRRCVRDRGVEEVFALSRGRIVELDPDTRSPSRIDTLRTASWTSARRRAWWSLRSKRRRAESATFIPGALQAYAVIARRRIAST